MLETQHVLARLRAIAAQGHGVHPGVAVTSTVLVQARQQPQGDIIPNLTRPDKSSFQKGLCCVCRGVVKQYSSW